MATKVNPNAIQTPPPRTQPVGPATQAPEKTVSGGEGHSPATPPASGFRTGTTGLQGKFAYAPGLRPGVFANPRAVGLNRPTDVLGPNKFTVGELLERIGEHLNDPAHPTAHDLALLNGAFTLGKNS